MTGTARTAGTTVLSQLAIPVGGLSAIGAAGSFLLLIFSPSSRTSGVIEFFLAASSLFGLTLYFLARLQKKGKALIAQINHQEALTLDPVNMLGYPSPVFMVFDRSNQVLAICNSANGQYELQTFSYVLAWHYTWTDRKSMEFSGPGAHIRGTSMQAPAFDPVVKRVNFMLVLEVADPARPHMKFPMSERAAIEWCARLQATFNG
jgi:hypothetical protein